MILTTYMLIFKKIGQSPFFLGRVLLMINTSE